MTEQPDLHALALRVASSAPSLGPVRLVCVDGPSGAGKTTVADALAAALAPSVGIVAVVHGDDLYEGWDVAADLDDPVRAFAALAARVRDGLLEPWSRGLPATFPVWNWHSDRWGPAATVPAADVVVLEGVGLAAAELRARACLVVWVDADAGTRAARVSARDGAGLDARMERWREREARWFASDATASAADVRLRTD